MISLLLAVAIRVYGSAILIKQQQPEKHVVVIEKGLCGSGASGANGGCMLTWSTKYPTLKKLYGKEQAKWLVKESEKVIYEIEAFCNEHKIDAHLYRSGTYYTATNEAQKGEWNLLLMSWLSRGSIAGRSAIILWLIKRDLIATLRVTTQKLRAVFNQRYWLEVYAESRSNWVSKFTKTQR